MQRQRPPQDWRCRCRRATIASPSRPRGSPAGTACAPLACAKEMVMRGRHGTRPTCLCQEHVHMPCGARLVSVTTAGGAVEEARCGLCPCPILSSCVVGALPPPYQPNAVPRRTRQSLKGLFRALYWASHSMSPRASRVSPVSPRTLTPETSSGRRRTPGVSAPPPLVWPCTAAPVLGLFCSRGQSLEKRLRLDYRRLARQPRGAPRRGSATPTG